MATVSTSICRRQARRALLLLTSLGCSRLAVQHRSQSLRSEAGRAAGRSTGRRRAVHPRDPQQFVLLVAIGGVELTQPAPLPITAGPRCTAWRGVVEAARRGGRSATSATCRPDGGKSGPVMPTRGSPGRSSKVASGSPGRVNCRSWYGFVQRSRYARVHPMHHRPDIACQGAQRVVGLAHVAGVVAVAPWWHVNETTCLHAGPVHQRLNPTSTVISPARVPRGPEREQAIAAKRISASCTPVRLPGSGRRPLACNERS